MNDTKEKSLMVIVGDISADRHVAHIITKLKELAPNFKIWGVGGSQMEAAGCELLFNCKKFATIGIIEPIKLLPFFNAMRLKLVEEIKIRKPNAVLLVDSGGFNIGFAQLIKPKFKNLPIIYFISPQVWGSRPWRINVLKNCITKMLTIFPFEESLYKSNGIDASFVGHPLLRQNKENKILDRDQFCQKYKLDTNKLIVGVFAGSRRKEIKDLTPIILKASNWLLKEKKEVQFVVSCVDKQLTETLIDKYNYRHLIDHGVRLITTEDNASLMSSADILWTKSGTTTLEASLFGKPMLIFYHANWLSYWIFLAFKLVKHVGWPNLLAGKTVVPELLQLDCRAEQLVKYTRDLLDVPEARKDTSNLVCQVKNSLGKGDFALNVASEILSIK